jgi:hypothetical protein
VDEVIVPGTRPQWGGAPFFDTVEGAPPAFLPFPIFDTVPIDPQPAPEPAPEPEPDVELPEVRVTATRASSRDNLAFLGPLIGAPAELARTVARAPLPRPVLGPLAVLGAILGRVIDLFVTESDRAVRRYVDAFAPRVGRIELQPAFPEIDFEPLTEVRIIGTRPGGPPLATPPWPEPMRPIRFPRVLPADIFQGLPTGAPTPIGDPFPAPELQPVPSSSPEPRIGLPDPFPDPFAAPTLRPDPFAAPTLRPGPAARPGLGPLPGFGTGSPLGLLTPIGSPGVGLTPDAFPAPGSRPGTRPGNCPPCAQDRKRDRKKRKDRTVCYRGTYVEKRRGLSKRRRIQIPCE